jgi:hypothetical protein
MKHLGRDIMAGVNTAMLLGTVVFVLIAAMVYPLIGDQVADLTNESGEDYVGADEAGLVAMIPLFYWLAILLVVIGIAIVAIRDTT